MVNDFCPWHDFFACKIRPRRCKIDFLLISHFSVGDSLSDSKKITKRGVVKGRKPRASRNKVVTFVSLVAPKIAAPEQPIPLAIQHSSPLAHLDYQDELKLKDQGLALFWQKHQLSGSPESVIPSPRPRGYRTTSKRKAVLRGSRLCLIFGDRAQRDEKKSFVSSPLEPASHERIFRFLQKKLSETPFKLAAAHLNHLIIRGSYSERVVIFNVDMMNGPLIRKFKQLAEHLRKGPVAVNGAFVYYDPTRSDYYLESRRPDKMNFKKIFGPEMLSVEHKQCRYRYHPTSFSQVNESMVGVMLEQARTLLKPNAKQSLLDLYCGYGLFSHYFGRDYRQVLGIDSEGPSIRAAVANGRANPGRSKFLARRITADLIDEVLDKGTSPDSVLLDPPRHGPDEGVIATLALRRPAKVLHIFCGVDQIPTALKEWEENGYSVSRIVPLDMFPGSINLEILILLTPVDTKPFL